MKAKQPIEDLLQEALDTPEAAPEPIRFRAAGTPESAPPDRSASDEAGDRLLADQLAIARALRGLRPEASAAHRRQGLQAILSLGRALARTAAREPRPAAQGLRPALRLAALLLGLTVGLAPMVGLAAPGQALYPLRQAAAQFLRWATGAVGRPFAERGDQEEPVDGRSGPADGGLPASGPTSLNDGRPPMRIGDGAPDDASGARAVAGLGPRGAGRVPALPPLAATQRATAAGTAVALTPTLDLLSIQGTATTVPPIAGQPSEPSTATPRHPTRDTPRPSLTARASAPPAPSTTAPPSPSTPTVNPNLSPQPPATPAVTGTSSQPSATVTAAPPTATATTDPGACDAVVAGQVRREDGGAVEAAELLFIRMDLPDGARSAGVAPSGRFESPGLCAGDYLVAALLLDGLEGAWDGVYDADGDGDPDVLALSAGARRLGVDINLRLSPTGEPQSPVCPGPQTKLGAELVNEDDRPLPGALLHLFGPLGPVYEASADASGRVDLGGICPGFYQAAATFEGGPATLLGFYDPDDDGQPDWIDLSDPGAGGPMLHIRLLPVVAALGVEGREP